MLKEFIEFVESVLPAVSTDKAMSAKAAAQELIEQFRNCDYFTMYSLLPEFSQGDMITEIPFSEFGDNGDRSIFKAKGVVLSTSCHIDQKDNLLIAPAFPVKGFGGNSIALRKNEIFDYFYMVASDNEEYYIDFSRTGTYSKELIRNGIEKRIISRVCSLNQCGYYMLIIKLTIFLMRKEDKETLNSRVIGVF